MSILACVREVFTTCFRRGDPEGEAEEYEMKPELPPRNRPARSRQERVEEGRLNFYNRLRGRTTRRQRRIDMIRNMEMSTYYPMDDIME